MHTFTYIFPLFIFQTLSDPESKTNKTKKVKKKKNQKLHLHINPYMAHLYLYELTDHMKITGVQSFVLCRNECVTKCDGGWQIWSLLLPLLYTEKFILTALLSWQRQVAVVPKQNQNLCRTF